jgi:hypothetical protein
LSYQTSTGMESNERLTGGPFTQLTKLVRRIGYNKDVDCELATVTAASPVKIKIDNMPLELEEQDLVIAEHLMPHSRKITITNSGNTSLTSQTVSEIGRASCRERV